MLHRLPFTLLLALTLALPATAQEQSRRNFETSKQLDVFNSLYRDLDLYYVDTLDAKKNIENAILYMLDQLDPYTVYYDESNTGELKQLTTGKYAGIGAVIQPRADLGRCIISMPYEGMPAAEAGLRRGDIILSIDGKDTGELGSQAPGDYSSAVSSQLRGQPGTTFDIVVRRPGVEGELTFAVTRRTIVQPSITCSALITDSIGYILLNGFTENTGRDVRLAFEDLKARGAKSLILDLRSNPGGLMSEAVKLVNLFIPRGREVISTRGKVKESTAVYKTQSEPLDLEMPIVVLTNYGTASAAEITSGALQDYDRAVIVGQRTYGKGLVQETRQLPYNGLLKLTTSRYYIPSGRCIQAYKFEDGEPVHIPDSLAHEFRTAAGRIVRDGGGITPDVIVQSDSLPNLLLYLHMSDQLFDYCVEYRNAHPTVASPEEFKLTDAEYAELRAYLKAHNFTYDRQSLRLLNELRKVAAREGYAEEAKEEFAALEAKLTHNEDFDFTYWEDEIRKLVEQIIVENYYYDRGGAIYNFRYDPDIATGLSILRDSKRYRELLAPPTGK